MSSQVEQPLYILSSALAGMPVATLKVFLHSYDSDYLLKLSNRSLALKHYELGASILDIVCERIMGGNQ